MMKKIVAIGALGGSGTRIIAEILIRSGIYFGDILNYPNDNLIFTSLFKSPKWYKSASQEKLKSRLKIFDKFMNCDILTFSEKYELFKSTVQNKTVARDYWFYYKTFFRKKLVNNVDYWGWKEPNTQIYLNEINNFYPNIKYVHVLRNGLDMAFSQNKYQLKNWGFKYHIYFDELDNDKETSIKQLDYWIESTKEVLIHQEKLKGRFYLLNYTDFCTNPQKEIDKLLSFLEINIDDSNKLSLSKLVKKTSSFNRHKKNDISHFRSDQIEFLNTVGFTVD